MTLHYPASGASSVRPHAVSSTSDGRAFQYDANGNQVERDLNGTIYDLDYDAENRLTEVTVGGETTTFVYDGDGTRVRKESGGNVTVYVGQDYEQESGQLELDVPDPGFESGGQWSHVPSGSWPGTSIWQGTWGTSTPHCGSYAESISNLASGYSRSPLVDITPGQTYQLSVYARGEIDPDDSYNKWYLRAYWYDANGNALNNPAYSNAYSSASVGASWTQYTGNVTAPAGAYKLKVSLHNSLLSGWVAFDDVAVKQGGDTVYSHGFESETWEEVVSTHPGTSIWRGTWGIARPRSGSYARALSNLHFGWVRTPQVNVSALKSYTVKVYARGEIDPDSSPGQGYGGRWMIRAYWYDFRGNYLSYTNLRAQDTVAGSWTKYSSLDFFPPPRSTPSSLCTAPALRAAIYC